MTEVPKAALPLRPIVASRGSTIYNTARFVANILAPLVGRSPQHLKNSEDLVNKLKRFHPRGARVHCIR